MPATHDNARGEPPRGRGLRREALILFPASLLLLAALGTVTLFAYRAAIARAVDDRRSRALREAIHLAERAASPAAAPRDFERLRDLVPPGDSVALFDARGALVWSAGTFDRERAERPEQNRRRAEALAAAAVEGPAGTGGDEIVAWAPFAPLARPGGRRENAERWLLRYASPEPGLAAEMRSLAILTPAVLVLSAAVAALAVAFFYALNRPLAALLERARQLPPPPFGAGAPETDRHGDETDVLLAAFDRALAALRATDADPSGEARRDAEARLARTVAELGELSAGVAHELRNSLGTLRGYLGLLGRRGLDAGAREEVGEALRETDALARVVDDFLAFARPDLGAVDTIDLGMLVERALADPSLAAATFARDFPPERIEIRGSERLLRRALRNLLLNAVESEAAKGDTRPIELAIRASGDRSVSVTIRDHGGGIEPAIAARLFAPFASGRAGGAGLGLALARRIVLLHGGRLELLDADGGGAVARLELPHGDSVTKGTR